MLNLFLLTTMSHENQSQHWIRDGFQFTRVVEQSGCCFCQQWSLLTRMFDHQFYQDSSISEMKCSSFAFTTSTINLNTSMEILPHMTKLTTILGSKIWVNPLKKCHPCHRERHDKRALHQILLKPRPNSKRSPGGLLSRNSILTSSSGCKRRQDGPMNCILLHWWNAVVNQRKQMADETIELAKSRIKTQFPK